MKSSIIDCTKIKRQRTSTDNAKNSGRPKSTVVSENIKNIEKIILKYRKMKLREIADILKKSKDLILHENFDMCKFLSK